MATTVAASCANQVATFSPCLPARMTRASGGVSTLATPTASRADFLSWSAEMIPKSRVMACSARVLRGAPARAVSSGSRGNSTSRLAVRAAADLEQLRGARDAIKELIESKACNPILIRLGWHDAGTFDKSIGAWPKQGGANGSIRFKPERDHGANAGLASAMSLLQPIQEQYPNVSYADLFQLASATAIEVAGGPLIPMRYGRLDAEGGEDCTPDGRLPDAGPPSPAEHLRNVFYRMGLNDKDIVALSGAHTLGRARPDRSGWGKEETKYTKNGPGTPGGSSWTVQWLNFDNSYFRDIKEKKDEDLLVLPTDAALFDDDKFKVHAERYASDQGAFFMDYAESHKKLSELGAKFDPPQGVVLDDAARPKKFIAAEYSSGNYEQKDLSASMKAKLREEYIGLGGSPDKPMQANYFLNIILVISALAVAAWVMGAI